MSTPRIEINLKKIIHNATALNKLYASRGIDIIAVTKAVCGNPIIAQALVESGIKILADSRISNIKRMRKANVRAKFLLLRTPFMSQIHDVVKYVDISLNTELAVLRKLSEVALKQKLEHQIILMVELGDLREGILPEHLDGMVEKVLKLKGIKLVGLGANLACFGGVKPDDKNMNYLSFLAEEIEKKFRIKLKFISGGNSANYEWFSSSKNVQRINSLRIGESIFLGSNPLNSKPISGMFTNAFSLVLEVIESKNKVSVPYGEIHQNSFGVIPKFNNQGLMNRVILGAGSQDVTVSGLIPEIDIEVLRASSDHLIVNGKTNELKIGEEVRFQLNYNALVSAMNSHYVTKYISKHECERIL